MSHIEEQCRIGNSAGIYSGVVHLGKTLLSWRDDVFKGTFTLGELYQIVKSGRRLDSIASLHMTADEFRKVGA